MTPNHVGSPSVQLSYAVDICTVIPKITLGTTTLVNVQELLVQQMASLSAAFL